jgi:Cof subfamily protein (haloacid dehalogenase superfamily)
MGLPKLIATDLDGTFFDDAKRVNEPLFDAILTQMEAVNARFVIATGNDRALIDKVFANFIGRFDYVANNGAQVITRGGEQLRLATLTIPQMKRAQLVVDNLDIRPDHGAVFNGLKRSYMLRKYEGVGQFFQQVMWYWPDLVFIDDISEIDEPIVKYIIHYPEQDAPVFIAEAQKILGDEAHVTTSGYGAVDIVAPTVNKATGLDYLAAHYGIAFEDMAAFGDGLNDLEMLKRVGHPVAMPNGDKFLLDQFDVAVADNNHDGVLGTIQTWL